jgi:hypothetical protein
MRNSLKPGDEMREPARKDSRRFPLPWTVKASDSAYWIEDAEGKRFGFTYFRESQVPIGPGYANVLTRREALMIARNLAKLPDLLRRTE